ncbi:MAG: DNA gyrase subunit A [Candidatus Bipolaricaulis sp.]|nr:DNA gyrase subunit A [Candidatus Bipolaricaulis sp.]MDD5219359.1 DNA gyrase subunit A [Candidatus Bipolaricaulis sp.]
MKKGAREEQPPFDEQEAGSDQIERAFIEEEMQQSYINYAMSVIRGRAIPDVRDGLKPVQRRILYGMRELGVVPGKPHRKSARVVGEVMGKFHPHGELAIYDTMVNMAQGFSYRYPLVDGQGNFGSIDGDPAAATRYTEARLSPVAMEFLEELGEKTVDWVPNFDESLDEPTVLPARVPSLLMNGSWGISVGMTTQIPPHHLAELIDGVIALMDDPFLSAKDLMAYIPGPDFPTGGVIMGRSGIEEMYRTGLGKMTVRGKATIEDGQIVITEIPYQVRKSTLVESIANKVQNGEIDGVSDLRDESDRDGLRIVVELKKSANPSVVLNQLYKFTPLERTFSAIFLVIIDGNPRTLSLKEILNCFIDFRREVVRRRTEHRLDVAKQRAHILEGYRIALANIDRVIEIIRTAPDTETETRLLQKELALTDEQIDAILKMRLSQLRVLESEKIDVEYEEKKRAIAGYEEILGSEVTLDGTIKRELREIADAYPDARRTTLANEDGSVDFNELIPDYDLMVTVTQRGYVNAPRAQEFRSQGRGGKGVIGQRTKDDDYVAVTCLANARDELLFFSDRRRVYRTQGHRLPSLGRDAAGKNVRSFIPLEQEELLRSILPVRSFADVEDQLCLMATANGIINKNRLGDYANVNALGIIALNADDDDRLVDVAAGDGGGDVILATLNGQTIRFREEEVRLTKRPSRGVMGIRLDEGDHVIGMACLGREITMDKKLLMVTTRGYGKRVALDDFPIQGRGGKGVQGIKLDPECGELVSIVVVSDQDEIIITTEAKVIRIVAGDINVYRRYARGVRLIQLEEDDRIVSVVRT